MSTEADPAALGESIAFHRRRRGLSQVAFAKQMSRSESWVSQVERGTRHVDRLSVLEKVADVLATPLSELVGEQAPFPVRPIRHASVEALRHALEQPSALPALLAEQFGGTAGRTQADVDQSQVTALWPLLHGAEIGEVSAELASLLPRLEIGSRENGAARRRKHARLLAEAYQVAAAALARVGETDAAWLAGDRAISSAQTGGDALLAVAGVYRLVLAFIGAQRFVDARRLGTWMLEALDPYRDAAGVEAWSLCGALHLAIAVASARSPRFLGSSLHRVGNPFEGIATLRTSSNDLR